MKSNVLIGAKPISKPEGRPFLVFFSFSITLSLFDTDHKSISSEK